MPHVSRIHVRARLGQFLPLAPTNWKAACTGPHLSLGSAQRELCTLLISGAACEWSAVIPVFAVCQSSPLRIKVVSNNCLFLLPDMVCDFPLLPSKGRINGMHVTLKAHILNAT